MPNDNPVEWFDRIKWGVTTMLAIYVGSQISDDIREANKSIQELNKNMVVVVHDMLDRKRIDEDHEGRIRNHEGRIMVLEKE